MSSIPRRVHVLVVDDEALLRNVVCSVLEGAIPGLQTMPVGSRAEASALLDRGMPIDHMVSEVVLQGANVSTWLGHTLLARPGMGLVTFSVRRPWLPPALLHSPRVRHVPKNPDRLDLLVDATIRVIDRLPPHATT